MQTVNEIYLLFIEISIDGNIRFVFNKKVRDIILNEKKQPDQIKNMDNTNPALDFYFNKL